MATELVKNFRFQRPDICEKDSDISLWYTSNIDWATRVKQEIPVLGDPDLPTQHTLNILQNRHFTIKIG